jgi:hypothetical protein
MSIELCNFHDGFHVRGSFRVFEHRLKILTATPLSVIRNSHAVCALWMVADTKPDKFFIVFSVASTSISANFCWFSGSTVKTLISVTTLLSFEIVVIRFPFNNGYFREAVSSFGPM